MFDLYEEDAYDPFEEEYNAIYQELCDRVEFGELTLEDAEIVNDRAFELYLSESEDLETLQWRLNKIDKDIAHYRNFVASAKIAGDKKREMTYRQQLAILNRRYDDVQAQINSISGNNGSDDTATRRARLNAAAEEMRRDPRGTGVPMAHKGGSIIRGAGRASNRYDQQVQFDQQRNVRRV